MCTQLQGVLAPPVCPVQRYFLMAVAFITCSLRIASDFFLSDLSHRRLGSISGKVFLPGKTTKKNLVGNLAKV